MRGHLRAPRALAAAVLIIGAAAPMLVMAQPAFASNTYTWSMTCGGTDKDGGEGGCNVSWNWTQNGTVIPNPTSGTVQYNSGFGCGGNCSGSSSNAPATQFVQPDTANGITATLDVCVSTGTLQPQCNTQTTTQSFAPGSHVSISLTASVEAKVDRNCFPGYPCGGGSGKVDEAAVFNLNS